MYYDQLIKLGIRLRRRSGSEKTTCPKCSEGRRNKKDPCLSVNITSGEFNCHNCAWKGNVRFTEKRNEEKKYQKPTKDMWENQILNEKIVEYAKTRSISNATLSRFNVYGKDEWMPQTQKKERTVAFPYIRDTEVINIKFRDGAKNFKLVKEAEMIFFGMQTLNGKHCALITEGEWDALACYEAGFSNDYEPEPDDNAEVVEHELGRWGILSVPNGASKGSQRLEYIDNCSDYLSTVDEFIICTDGDEAGYQLREELVRRLGVEKCRLFEYPGNNCVPVKEGGFRKCKDLNEVLQYLGKDNLVKLVLSSSLTPIDGINYLEDIFAGMLENFRKGVQLAPTTRFKVVDEFFRWKKGDINLFSGYANYGKTTFVIQLMLIKSIYDGWKWAIFSPENYPANDFYDDIVEMYAGKWLANMTEKEYTDACDFINKHFFYVYPKDEHDLESIHEKFRYLVLKKGVDGVMIDPFNQIDKEQKPYERDDQFLSNALKVVKRFALLNSVVYNIIAHPKNPSYEKGKELSPVEMYDLAGGAMWGNKCDNITVYHRPNFHVDKNSPEVQIRQIKTKRKRTGGSNGEFDLRLLWAQKRFCDPATNDTPCDPKLAIAIKAGENIIGSIEMEGIDSEDCPF